MDSGVGTILREARSRREVELSEVEASTRIRLRFLRAIEDEEWDVLPGGTYTRGFIRTYAAFLGLDGERLVEDYRESVERWHRDPGEQVQALPPREREREAAGRNALIAGLTVVAVLAAAALVIVALPGGSDSGGPVKQAAGGGAGKARREKEAPPAARAGVTVRLAAAAEVWACLLDGKGRALIDGLILEAGAEEGPFHSGSFTVSFGNGEVEMLINGSKADIPATSSPIGYAIDSAGGLTELDEAERPTCT